MKKIVLFSALCALINTICVANSAVTGAAKLPLYTKLRALQAQCKKAPVNPLKTQAGFVSQDNFMQMIADFTAVHKNQLMQPNVWFNRSNPLTNEFFTTSQSAPFIPYAQKLVVPSGSEIAFFGDLHGNVHAFTDLLNDLQEKGYISQDLKIIKSNFYMIFLGDYVDRGSYGVELLYTLMQLKVANPQQVIMVRGNHEDCTLNAEFGFADELHGKFPKMSTQEQKKLYRMYDFMPTVLYVGCANGSFTNYVQCCHGGMELGFNPSALLQAPGTTLCAPLQELKREQAVMHLPARIKRELIQNIPECEIVNFAPRQPTDPLTIGFLWHDFISNPEIARAVDYTPGRGWVYGKALTNYLLEQASGQDHAVRGVFRAHQHHGHMLELLREQKGIVSLWDGIVYTFLSVPLEGADFNYRSLGILKVAPEYSDWKLEHHVRQQ